MNMGTYTKVTTKSYGSRIMDSIKGIIFGLILFIVSFFVLWMNEGTVDMSVIAETSIEVSSESIDVVNNNKLISVSGKISSEEMIGDDLYLKPGKYISVYRKVEMYSWEETTDSETEKNLGGSETTTTTYDYNTQWTEFPDDSSGFEISEGHNNPEKSLKSDSNKVVNSNIGAYNFDTQSIGLPGGSTIKLTDNILTIDKTATGGILLVDGFLFQGKGTLTNPKIGDIRISYSALKDGVSVTAMGKQREKGISSFSDKGGNTLYRVFNGTRDNAISTLRTEYLFKLWGFRALGFILMWIGLSMLLGPISVLLDVLPVAGSISRGIIGIITFIIAFILSVITILISMVFHNIYALIVVIAIVGFFLFKFIKKKMNKKEDKLVNSMKNNTGEKSKEIKTKTKGESEVTLEVMGTSKKSSTKKNNDSVGFDIQ